MNILRKHDIPNLVVLSDLHAGCQLALYPCDVPIMLDNGGSYTPSVFQQEIFNYWQKLHSEWIAKATKNEPFMYVINGDIIDGVHHNANTLITSNIHDQKKIAEALIAPLLKNPKCEGLYMIRGTSVHVGESGKDEEDLARDLGAIPTSGGRYSRYVLNKRVGKSGYIANFSHHIGISSSQAYKSSAPMREFSETQIDAALNQKPGPTFVVRSHRHGFICIEVASKGHLRYVLTTPGWQMKTPNVYRSLGGRNSTPEMGLIVLRESTGGYPRVIPEIIQFRDQDEELE